MSEPARERLLTPTFVLLATSHFLHSLAFHLYLHLPGFLASVGAKELAIGLIFGLASATAILARPAIGRVMDDRGRLPIVWLGGALGIVASASYLVVDHIGPLVYAIRAVHGLSEAMLFASLFAFAADIVPASRRIEGIGLFGVSGMLPMAIGGAAGDRILERFGYDGLFVVATLACVVATALSIPLREPARAAGEKPRGLAAALFDRKLLPLWACGLCFATAIGAYFSFLKTYVLAHPIGSVGDFFGSYALVACALRVFFGRVPERVGPKRVLAVALVSLLTGLVLLALGGSRATLIAAGLTAGMGHGYAFPILLGLVVERARATERGAALAIYTALFDAGTLLGGPLWGALIERAGYPTMFGCAAGLVVSGGVVLWSTDR